MDAAAEIDKNRAVCLDAAVPLVARAGWLGLDMAEIAEKAGCARAELDLLFPAGAVDMADFFLKTGDQRMRERAQEMDMPDSVRRRIGHLIFLRLAADQDHKEVLRRTSALFMLPFYAPRGAACLARSCDLIWRLAGDQSADFNYYTKRFLLAGIFSESLFVFLTRRGMDEAYMRSFIAGRIDRLMTAASLLRGFLPQSQTRAQRK